MSAFKYWWYEWSPVFFVSIGLLLFIALLMGGVFWTNSASCHSKARALGVGSSWGPLQGCIVITEDGRRYPMERYAHEVDVRDGDK